MKVSRRFQLAVHIVLFVAIHSEERNLTCEYISKEIKGNPVVVKNILNILYKNNFFIKSSNTAGIKLKKTAKDITLWDIYKATDETNIKEIFDNDLNIANPVVEDLPDLLSVHFETIMKSIENALSKVSIESLLKKYNYNIDIEI